MELITFNTWGGRLGESPIRDFCEKYRNVDVFCFQEIWETHDLSLIDDPKVDTKLLSKMSTYLPEHQVFFRPQYRGIYGLATFVHKRHAVADEGELFVFKEQGYENPVAMGNHARNIQFVHLKMNGKALSIINFHGLWNGVGKTDSADRILQSEKIASFMRKLTNPYLIAGDFNLEPETESIKIIERVCPQNLIKSFGITSTRSSHYPKPGKYADYILMSMQLNAKEFEVLPDEASDHLALKVKVDH
jgi:endonuclease/exonuclease/phosphatase family metal-dependent hydrolase